MKRFVRLISTILVFAMTLSIPAIAQPELVRPINFQNARLIEQTSAGVNGVFKSYIDNQGRLINARETTSGFLEYAYNENGIVHSFEFQNGKMLKHTVLTDKDFNEIIEELSPDVEKKMNAVLRQKEYSTTAELQSALKSAGISAHVYEDSDGDFVVDPFVHGSALRASSTTSKNIGIDGLKSEFPAMSRKQVASKSFKAKPDNVTKTMYCKDTRTSYAKVKNSTNTLSTGLKVVEAAVKVYVTPNILRKIFGLANTVVTLTNSFTLTRSIRASANCLRQAFIKDYTNSNQWVSVKSYNATDYFGVGKASDSSPYGWFCEYQSLFDRVSKTTTLDEGIRIWNYNMQEYGRWKWGNA